MMAYLLMFNVFLTTMLVASVVGPWLFPDVSPTLFFLGWATAVVFAVLGASCALLRLVLQRQGKG